MARIAGINIPINKHVDVALTAVYGIGRKSALKICQAVNVNHQLKMKDLTDKEVDMLRSEIAKYKVEGDLRRDVAMNIKRLMDLGCYRGIRHRRGLPVRGQNTQKNARTRKGKKRQVRK